MHNKFNQYKERISQLKYYSQYSQDKFIDKFVFKKKTNGFFVDIGAYDGITFSNTFFLEKYRHWNGICIEPIPHKFNELKKNRNCTCLNACVDNNEGEVEFLHVDGPSEMLSGIVRAYDNEHLKRINNEIETLGGEKKLIKVKAININNYFANNKINTIDYLSIDVEGNELMILKTIDFSKLAIKAISVEDNYKSKELHNFLISKGFRFVGRLSDDKIFVDKNVSSFSKLKLICFFVNYFNKLKRFLAK